MDYNIVKLFLVVWVNILLENVHASSACEHYEVDDCENEGIKGEYTLTHRCIDSGTPVYQHEDKKYFLYSHKDSNFTGWLIGDKPCTPTISEYSVIAKLYTSAMYPEYSKSNWQEKINGRYLNNDEMEVECEDGMSTFVLVVIALTCAVLVVLFALAPLAYVYVAKKKNNTNNNRNTTRLQQNRRTYPSTNCDIYNIPTAPANQIHAPVLAPPSYQDCIKLSPQPPSYDESMAGITGQQERGRSNEGYTSEVTECIEMTDVSGGSCTEQPYSTAHNENSENRSGAIKET